MDDESWMKRSNFLEQALSTLNSPKEWERRANWLSIAPPEERESTTVFGTASELHKCAEWVLANRDSNPIREGARNVVYFNLAKMFSNYEGFDHNETFENMRRIRDSAVEQGVDPITDGELATILASAERGKFTSTGCDDPLMQPYTHPDCPIAKGER